VVQPNGTVVVPFTGNTSLLAFHSSDGGATWSAATAISSFHMHTVAGNMRTSVLPSAEIAGGGKIFVVWQDCRFENGCAANDIVMSTSTNGTTWSAAKRIPIDPVGSGVDHFIPGLAVDHSTGGATTHLALTYYYYPQANCTASTCQLDVGYVSSQNAGASWSAPTQLAGPMTLSWLASTNEGVMVGDYISTSIASGGAVPVFAVAQAPAGSVLNEAMYSAQLTVSGGALTAPDNEPVRYTSPVKPVRGALPSAF
jgi:hypothetical protein